MICSELQNKVIMAAKELIGDKPWFCGLNFEALWDDQTIEKEGVQAAAQALAMETALWDADDFFNP